MNIDVAILRYFNPLGNHPSGVLGDPLTDKASNIMPMIYKSMKYDQAFHIFGQDYDTTDGAPIRDYIHVLDLAEAHEKSLQLLAQKSGVHVLNIGLGDGVSVKQLLQTYQRVNSTQLKVIEADRRKGDLPVCFAKNDLMTQQLNWQPQFNLQDMCRDAHQYFIKNVEITNTMIIQDKQHSVIVACVAFFLLVLGIFFFQNDDINRDGVGYLIQANLIEQQQQQLAKTLYPNLGFASLIASVKQQLGFGLHQTAMLLNMIFLFGSLTFFLIILKQVNSDCRLRVMAILTVAASIPLMDTYLSMIIRDHGFWCMSLMGLCCLTLWMNSKKMIWTLFAYLAFILAAFFVQRQWYLLWRAHL
jgi:hypothetical protein